MVNILHDIEKVADLIRSVGDYQVSRFRSAGLKTYTKTTDIDMLTEVDLESERMIVEWIEAHYPSHSILTEEREAIDRESPYTWIIDPLDGTTNFSRGIPIFAISIALHLNGRRERGWVYLPYFGDLYTAKRGHGAWCNGERLQPLKTQTIGQSVLASGFAYDHQTNPDNNVYEISQLIPAIKGFRRMGAAAYDLCMVAQGGLDGFWERGLKPWDVEAGLLMIEEVGGVVADALSHGGAPMLVAGNPDTVKEMLSILNKD